MIRAWYRMVLRLFAMITQALRNQALVQMNIPGPRGMRSRQIIQSAGLLEVEELERRKHHHQRTDNPTEWSKVTHTIPSGPEANMWQIPPKDSPKCHCQLMTQKNYQRLFWRCPRARDQLPPRI